MKTRTKNKRYFNRTTGLQSADGPFVNQTSVISTVLTDSRDDGTKMPDWRGRIRRNESATTFLSGTKYDHHLATKCSAKAVVEYRKYGTGVWVEAPLYFSGLPAPLSYWGTVSGTILSDLDDAEAKAARAYVRKVNDFDHAIQGMVVLGEIRETLRMLRNPAKSFYDALSRDYIKGLRRHKGGSSAALARAARKQWLESVFGWMPFISDMESASELISRLNEERLEFRSITAVGLSTKSGNMSTGQSTETWFTYRSRSYDRAEGKVKYRAKLINEPDAYDYSSLGYLTRQSGFSWNQFVPTAWELLPWSFLFDYFSNIGDVLEHSFLQSRYVRWAQRTARETRDRVNSASVDWAAFKAYYGNEGNGVRVKSIGPESIASLVVRRTSFQRTAGGPAVPDFRIELPGRAQPWLNMGALWSQANEIHPQRAPRYRGPIFRS